MAGRRSDNIDLIEIAKNRGYIYVNSRNAMNNIDIAIQTKQ